MLNRLCIGLEKSLCNKDSLSHMVDMPWMHLHNRSWDMLGHIYLAKSSSFLCLDMLNNAGEFLRDM